MLPSEKNDLLYLLNILEHIGKIWKYTEKTNRFVWELGVFPNKSCIL
jgi:uncharacterized protein with HEPN domain